MATLSPIAPHVSPGCSTRDRERPCAGLQGPLVAADDVRVPVVRVSRLSALALAACAALSLPGSAPAAASELEQAHRLTAQAPHLPPAPADRPWAGRVHLVVDGRERSFSVHVPAGLPARAPLVLGLHGLHQTRAGAEATMGLLREAAARRVIVAYPAGWNASWNAGRCCGRAASAGVDDVGFLRRVVAEVDHLHRVDPSRVSAVGYSNGAMLAHRLVCDAPGWLSAVGAVAGADLTGSACRAAVPTPTMIVHGGRDTTVPEAGLRSSTFLGTAVPPLATTAAAVERRNAPAGVRTLVVRLPTEGHGWPTTRSPSGYDTTRQVLDFALRARRPLGVRAAPVR